MFNSECDLAAIVYERTDDPDRLLREFADDLQRSGYRLAGLIQCGFHDGQVPVKLLPEGDIIQLTHSLGPSPEGCNLDPAALAEAAAKIANAIDQGADLVMVNRFGKMEVSGMGLVDEICRAVLADIPVLVAVPKQNFTMWTRFSQGMSVKLACSRQQLNAWWQTVRVGTDGIRPGTTTTFCEIAK